MATNPDSFPKHETSPTNSREDAERLAIAVNTSANNTDFGTFDEGFAGEGLPQVAFSSESEAFEKVVNQTHDEVLKQLNVFYDLYSEITDHIKNLNEAGFPYEDNEKLEKYLKLGGEIAVVHDFLKQNTVNGDIETLKLNLTKAKAASTEMVAIKINIEKFARASGFVVKEVEEVVVNDLEAISENVDKLRQEEIVNPLYVELAQAKIDFAKQEVLYTEVKEKKLLRNGDVNERWFTEVRGALDGRGSASLLVAIQSLAESIASGKSNIKGDLGQVVRKAEKLKQNLEKITKALAKLPQNKTEKGPLDRDLDELPSEGFEKSVVNVGAQAVSEAGTEVSAISAPEPVEAVNSATEVQIQTAGPEGVADTNNATAEEQIEAAIERIDERILTADPETMAEIDDAIAAVTAVYNETVAQYKKEGSEYPSNNQDFAKTLANIANYQEMDENVKRLNKRSYYKILRGWLLELRELNAATIAYESNLQKPEEDWLEKLYETDGQLDGSYKVPVDNQLESTEEIEKEISQLNKIFNYLKVACTEKGEENHPLLSEIAAIFDAALTYKEEDVHKNFVTRTEHLRNLQEAMVKLQADLSERWDDDTYRLAYAGLPTDKTVGRTLDFVTPPTEHQRLRSELLTLSKQFKGELIEVPDLEKNDGSMKTERQGSIKNDYEKALQDFYENQKWQDQAKNFFGFKPKFPAELEEKRTKYESVRNAYAEALDKVLQSRQGVFADNKQYDRESSSTKKAFGQKFILEHYQKQLEMQQEVALAKDRASKIKPLLALLNKNKWGIRLGSVVLAGGIGAVTGGAASLFFAAAGSAAARVGVSTLAGMGAGVLTNKGMQGRVDRAGEKIEVAASNVTNNFSLIDLNILERELFAAAAYKNKMKGQQRGVTIAAAAVAGFSTGLGTGLAMSNATTIPVEDGTGLKVAEPLNKESVGGKVAEPIKAEMENTLPVLEREISGRVVVPTGMRVDGVSLPELKVIGINLAGEKLNLTALGESQGEVKQFIDTKTTGYLSSNPNLTKEKLSGLLFAEVEKKYAGSPWWTEAGIKQVTIANIEATNTPAEAALAPAQATSAPRIETPVAVKVVPEAPVTNTESPAAATRESADYNVKPDDRLWNIVKDKFADTTLKGLSPEQQNIAIGKLLEEARVNPTLRDSLALKSVDNIDRIYAGETIKLQGLETELKKIVAGESMISRPKTGAMTIESIDNGVGKVPIKIAAAPVDPAEFGAVVPEKGLPVAGVRNGYSANENYYGSNKNLPLEGERIRVSANDGAVFAKMQQIPKPVSLTGNYFNTTEYKQYITQNYGSLDNFNKLISKEARAFEAGTYDAVEKFMGTDDFYESPYKKFANMTMAEIDSYREKLTPTAGARQVFGEKNLASEFGEYGQMKYETYRAWMTRIDELKKTHEYAPSTKLSDLFARSVAEAKEQSVQENNKFVVNA